ncbi:OsmC family protein [Peteryoungia desertarenae]|uniref:OsmC family protein n=1 Tax=Peteryoungia desertarenae TaxID=1813451 RepID=A0ABX6QIQ1_9HYPH|nr:OsmC family protein [Peteryoungia desertarenae]QLF68236.1 OsmC family protein [Peteryoungia desertarenae]
MAVGKDRPIGAVATLGARGYPHIRSRTGGEIRIATGAEEAGFNPLDLLLAALASCLSMSVRIAAREHGQNSYLTEVTVDVTAEKDAADKSRLSAIYADIVVTGELSADMLDHIVQRADDLCTVSNALAIHPIITVRNECFREVEASIDPDDR